MCKIVLYGSQTCGSVASIPHAALEDLRAATTYTGTGTAKKYNKILIASCSFVALLFEYFSRHH